MNKLNTYCFSFCISLIFGFAGCADSPTEDALPSPGERTNQYNVPPNFNQVEDEQSNVVKDDVIPDDDQSAEKETVQDTEPEKTEGSASAGGACASQAKISDLEACCDHGAARCLPMSVIPGDLKEMLAECPSGGACVPEEILYSMKEQGGYSPKVCQSLNGEGRCISTCVPMVGDFKDLLPQDICAPSERCAPCINPLTNADSGACGEPIECSEIPDVDQGQKGDDPHTPADDSAGEAPASGCDNPPNIDPSTFPECECAGTRCVPTALVTEEQQAMLASCKDGFCVPDKIVSTGGFFKPKTCTSLGGTEGRCLSKCIPEVAERADKLPVDVCDADEACSPCCDPFTGEDTGACSQGCDTGLSEGTCEPLYETCCSDDSGHCIDNELIPQSQQKQLKKCDKNTMCVPEVFQDSSWGGSPCQGYMWMSGSWYAGVCLPGCLKLPKLFLDGNACPGDYVCAPCVGPFGKPTGAPGC